MYFCNFSVWVWRGSLGNDSCASRCQSASCPVLSRWDYLLGSGSVSRSEAGAGSRSKLHFPEPNQNCNASSDSRNWPMVTRLITQKSWGAGWRGLFGSVHVLDFGPLQACIVASLNAGLSCTALITNSDLGDAKSSFFTAELDNVFVRAWIRYS